MYYKIKYVNDFIIIKIAILFVFEAKVLELMLVSL
jgi:hypothetical protein